MGERLEAKLPPSTPTHALSLSLSLSLVKLTDLDQEVLARAHEGHAPRRRQTKRRDLPSLSLHVVHRRPDLHTDRVLLFSWNKRNEVVLRSGDICLLRNNTNDICHS